MLLASCAPVPNLGPKPLARAPESIASEQSLGGGTQTWPVDQWWASYGDPQLNALIDEGLRSSPDVAAAAARFRRANGLAEQAGAALLPTLDAQGQATLEKQSYNNGFPKEFVPKGWQDTGQLSLNLGFDLDLWGRNRASLAAATSDAEAAAIDARQAQLMLTTGIADAYADLARLYAERDIQQHAVDIRVSTQKLVTQRVANGLDTRGDQRQAEANAATARANLAEIEETIALRKNQIAALVGAGPDRSLSITPPAITNFAPRGLPRDVTTNLVGRRPDIAAARARAEAAASRIKVAHADFYPAIRLDGLIGFQSLGVAKLIAGDSLFGSVGPAVTLPIFHGGALSGQYRGARGTYDEAIANYDKTVLTAYQEVADAVTSQHMLDQRLAEARNALTASEEAYSIARKRYEGGLSTYLDVLTVEEHFLAARQSVATLQTRGFALDIALVRALGGGFAATANTPKDNIHG
jgi:NodT family efflux transporter outer membrane factor (OMF) lipoprotein